MFEIEEVVQANFGLQMVPIVGQAYRFTKTTYKVYNSTNPLKTIRRAVIDIAIDCAPPQIKYPLKCTALLIQIAIIASGGALPFSAAVCIALGTQILEEKL